MEHLQSLPRNPTGTEVVAEEKGEKKKKKQKKWVEIAQYIFLTSIKHASAFQTEHRSLLNQVDA